MIRRLLVLAVILGVVLFAFQSGSARAQENRVGDTKDVAPFFSATEIMVVDDTPTATELAELLVGAGPAAPTISNVSATGSPSCSGQFIGGSSSVLLDSGILLGSGEVVDVVGPNLYDATTTAYGQPGDADLNSLVPGYTSQDGCVLEFDFVCPAGTAGDPVISFQYVFSSEEYNEYVNSSYNDVFGFFVNGSNVALLPDNVTPVSINNVNNGFSTGGSLPGSNPSNPAYYRNNDLQNGGGTIDIEADGLTVVLGAESGVNDGSTNHLKLAIADVGDQSLDSWVFIEAGSFVCQPLNQPPTAEAGPDASGDEGSPIALVGSVSDPDGDSVSSTWSVDDPALCSFDNPNALDTNITCTDNGTFVVTLTADDGNGGVTADTSTVTVNNVAPVPGDFVFTPDDTVELGSSVHMEISYDDPGSNDTHEAIVQWSNGESCNTADVGAACSVDQGANKVIADHTYAEADVYLVHVQIIDDDAGFNNRAYPYVVVWDPNAGFVTGNGSIQNDAAKDFPDDSPLEGKKGDFGFVSKPQSDGTLFGKAQYRLSDQTGILLDFVAKEGQEWLVIDDEQAIFQGGQGKIDGQMDSHGLDYQFFISVIDGKYTGDPDEKDFFRIQIKDSQGGLVYDTQYGALMSADANTPTILPGSKIFIRHNYAAANEDGLIIVGNPPAELLDALRDGPTAPVEGLDLQFFLPSLNR